MTPAQIFRIEESYRHIAPRGADLAPLFFRRLFALDPSLRRLFGDGDLRGEGQRLMAGLGFVVGALRRPETLVPVVRELGRRHSGRGVRPHHYASFGSALFDALEALLGEDFTPELQEAWAAAYGMIAVEMTAEPMDMAA